MKYIYILENDQKFRDEMIEAIQKIDPQLAIRWFESLDEFSKWIRSVFTEGQASLPKGGQALPNAVDSPPDPKDQLVLVISKNEFLGAKHMNLLRKTRDLFIAKGLCTQEDPTSLVLTSFDSPDFDIKLVEDRIINNVIFKPFDKLILLQLLTYAVGGRHPPSQYAIHNMKTAATIEMLKEVEVEALSDVGFISSSNRPILVGSISKYYGPAFVSLKHRSMMAICIRCEPHPELKDNFRCAFSYFSADSYQITNIRKEVRKKEYKSFSFDWIPKVAKEPLEFALIAADDELSANFKINIEKHFSNITVHVFPQLQSFLYAVDPELAAKDKTVDVALLPKVPATFHAIFADDFMFVENFKERWTSVFETLTKRLKAPATNPSGKTEVFVLAKKFYSDAEERALGEVVKDIFYLPLDTLYLSKKLSIFLPQLISKEEISLPTVDHKHVAKVANPIEISEFSEAGLVMKYYRPISAGAFREFVLWLPHELDLPEFLAACNFSEENKAEKGSHFNHFVFFGTNDHFLQHIRRWILQNHVHSKESEGS
jgi:hypothetical protein